MINNFGALRTFSYAQYQQSTMGGKIYVPVSENQVMYTQFKYISGFAAPQSDNGLTIDKVKILNTLIDQLVTMKQDIKPSVSTTNLTDKQIDSLIQTYQDKITTTMSAAEANPYILGGVKPQSGTAFSIGA